MEKQTPLKKPTKVKYDETRKMMALQYHGKKDVRVGEVPVPLVTDPTDVVVRVTASTVCGSDLHLYHDEVPETYKGDILGHESVGVVDSVGSEVKTLKVGDRVTISAVIACGQCAYCKRGEWSCCDTTNTSESQAKLYGHCIGGLFGYSHMVGGYDGCQAEYVRVPFADINCFKTPDGISDVQALMVSDIATTGYHGNYLADVKEGDSVVVFGCGPVGLMAQMWAKHRKARIVVAIDIEPYRLQFAKDKFGCEIINGKEEDPIKAVDRLIPGGPDKVIDCVGFRFPDGLLHKIERLIKLETDAPNIVNTAIQMVRKNGKIGLIGDYFGYTNHFNLGAFMEKHLSMAGGQLWPQLHKDDIFKAMADGSVDPTVVITHKFPMSKFAEAYAAFDKHEDGMIKVLVVPDHLYKAE